MKVKHFLWILIPLFRIKSLAEDLDDMFPSRVVHAVIMALYVLYMLPLGLITVYFLGRFDLLSADYSFLNIIPFLYFVQYMYLQIKTEDLRRW